MVNLILDEKDYNKKAALLESSKFKKWLEKIESTFIVESVFVYRVDMFGKNVGFVYAEANLTDKNGNRVPSKAFIRGDSVSIFLVLKDSLTNEKFAVLTYQPRVPAGMYMFESPAGMIDEGDFKFKAIEELKEEVSSDLKLDPEKLIFLERGFTSPGGIDEEVVIYTYEVELSNEEINKLNNKQTGLEGENITLKIVPVDSVLDYSLSMTTRLAAYAYNTKNLLSSINNLLSK